MNLNKLFDVVEKTREAADWRTAFGEPQKVEGRTIIPVANVGYGFGLGFGQGDVPPEAEAEEVPGGGGAGGGASAKPLGVIVVTPEGVTFEETVDATRIAIAAFLMGAFSVYQVTRTLRAIWGQE